MSFYFFKLPSRPVLAATVLGGSTAVVAYAAWDVMRSRRNAVPLFNSGAVVRTEESARYPCQHLRGFDVVVRSYYVPTENSEPETSTSREASPSTSLSARLRNFTRLFSNSTHKVNDDSRAAAEADDVSSLRMVVRDARDAAALPAAARASSRSLSHDAEKEKEMAATTLLAASRWPAHTAKYAALVLQPSSSTDGQSAGSSSRSLLRQLADGATHQSLVRCNPRSTLLDMACEGDPSYLGAPYLRVLLSGFLLLPSTLSQLNVAVLGVGGGSLPLFLQEYFASRMHRCDLVDVEPMCFKAAVEQLGLKEKLNTVALQREGGGVHYYVEDAVAYLHHRAGTPTDPITTHHSSSHGNGSRVTTHGSTPVFPPTSSSATATAAPAPPSAAISHTRQRQLDLLFVDLFVGSELDDAVTSVDFLRLCRGALSPYGVAAFNLPASDKAFVQRCGVVFGGQNVFRIPVPASSNEVVLVRGGAESPGGGGGSAVVGPEVSHRHFYRRAQELTAQYRLPYDLANHYPVWWRFW